MKIIISFLLVIIGGISVFCQEQQKRLDELEPKYILRRSTCDMNSNLLYTIGNQSETKDLIIIVSHLSKTENKKWADRRLHNARTYLIRSGTKWEMAERIISTKGEESSDTGYLDFFVKGRLELRLYIPRNSDFRVEPCVQDSEQKPCSEIDAMFYYPCKTN